MVKVSDDYSLGEVSRRMDEVTARLETLGTRMETTYVRFDLFEASKQLNETERVQLSKRVDKLESRSEWLVRAVGGGIISTMLAAAIALTRIKTGA